MMKMIFFFFLIRAVWVELVCCRVRVKCLLSVIEMVRVAIRWKSTVSYFFARYVLSFHDFVVFIYLFFVFFADLLNCDACGKKKSNEK